MSNLEIITSKCTYDSSFYHLESSEGFRFAIFSLFLHVAEKVVSTVYITVLAEKDWWSEIVVICI